MSAFFRFPHTPHLAWLGEGEPRDDKVLSRQETVSFLEGPVVVEEKLDGANIGISLDSSGSLRVQNRGQYLQAPYKGQFSRLNAWLGQYDPILTELLTLDMILFGEWCAAKHSLEYTDLPDWFLLFDVYDKAQKRFWSSSRRNELAKQAGLAMVPQMMREEVTLSDLKHLLVERDSVYRAGPLEGLVIRRENEAWCEERAKLVRADFTQGMGEHWRRRQIEWNKVKLHAS
tara:strand:- start:6327 stop:7016 length:690 start_codon:yes stop_codon:yes gene_type:complete